MAQDSRQRRHVHGASPKRGVQKWSTTRQALAKHVKVLAEAAKTAIRAARQKAMKLAKSEATKEQVKRSEKVVEAATKAAVDEVESAMKAKEKDVLTVGT